MVDSTTASPPQSDESGPFTTQKWVADVVTYDPMAASGAVEVDAENIPDPSYSGAKEKPYRELPADFFQDVSDRGEQ